MMAKLHCEPIYGFYHGQDPRIFSPDYECCSEQEIAHHKAICEAAEAGTWTRDNSGCHHTRDAIVCTTSCGLGVYHVVMDEDGNFLRDASYEDYQRDGEWEEL